MTIDSDERLVPEKTDYETLWEHVARYAFACKAVGRSSVLDLACGDGYGTLALSKSAASVIGVDADELTVELAISKYGLDYRVGNAEKIPVPNASVDYVVSFETVEHLEDAPAFMLEAFRVLKNGGKFILSTPNKNVYHAGETANQFHTKEYNLDEVFGLLRPRFNIFGIYGQSFPQSPLDRFEEKIGRLSAGLRKHFHKHFTERLRNRYTPGVDTTSTINLSRFIESIPTLHRTFIWRINRVGLRPIKPGKNLKCKYFVVVAQKMVSE